ncbi:hypothetical protein Tco_0440589, partial [Tanacetum coccineum]
MCKSVVELQYHLEEVFKATNDLLDWHNPEGRPYFLSSYGDVVTIPKGHDDADKDEEPSAGSNRGTKRRR